eukprot:4416429-Karenia_brevis.AAC.1
MFCSLNTAIRFLARKHLHILYQMINKRGEGPVMGIELLLVLKGPGPGSPFVASMSCKEVMPAKACDVEAMQQLINAYVHRDWGWNSVGPPG